MNKINKLSNEEKNALYQLKRLAKKGQAPKPILRVVQKFNKAKKTLDMSIPEDHVIPDSVVIKNLKEFEYKNYILWIGHATFLIKLGNTTIITDPFFSKNSGPLIFGPKRYVDPAIQLDQLPKTN